MILTTQEELDASVALWQERLNLRDWDVRANFMGFGQANGNEGHVYIQRTLKQALVQILAPDEWKATGSKLWHQDNEETLVHELLHIHFDLIEPDEDDQKVLHDMWEQAIQSLAKSFVALDRRCDSLRPDIAGAKES